MRRLLSPLLRVPFGWLIVAALAMTGTAAHAQPQYGLSPDAYAAFSKWMTTSCVGDEARTLRETLQRYRSELAPAFRKALVEGPAAEDVRAVRAAADARYADLARFPIREYRVEGASAQDLARFTRTSRQTYVTDQVQRYVTGYRSNAVAGLAVVGGTAERTLLTRTAARRGDPLAPAAAEALRTMERP